MVEQFRAEIDIDGNAGGALASIAAVEAALKKLNNQSINVGVNTKGMGALVGRFDKIRENVGELDTAFKQLRSRSGSFISTADFRNAQHQLGTFRKKLDGQIKDLNDLRVDPTVRTNPAALKEIDKLSRAMAELDKVSGESAQNLAHGLKQAETAGVRRAAAAKKAAEAEIKEAERVAKHLEKIDKASRKRATALKRGQTIERRIVTMEETRGVSRSDLNDGDLDRAAQSVRKYRDELRALSKTPKARRGVIWDENHSRALSEYGKAVTKLDTQVSKAEKTFRDYDKSLANAADRSRKLVDESVGVHRELDRVAKSTGRSVSELKRMTPGLTGAINEVTNARRNLRAVLGEDPKSVGWLDRQAAAYKQLEVAARSTGAQVQRIPQQLEAARAKQVSNLDKTLRDIQAAEARLNQAQGRLQYAEQESFSESDADRRALTTQRLADAHRDYSKATNELARARAHLNSIPAGASAAVHLSAATAVTAALREQVRATNELTQARQVYNETNLATSQGVRYAMFDAAQQQGLKAMMLGAVPVASTIAYGMLESSFSDYQRTAGIDGFGVLQSGAPALNLADFTNTASDQAFRGLLNIGTKLPTSLSGIFDTAVKAGSIGLEGVGNTQRFVETVAKFNSVADIAAPEQSAEALGRMGNLMGTDEYQRIAAAIVNVGTAAAATDDEIMSTTEELAQAAAGANFTTDAIVGLAGGFASLAIPPERARSVMQQFVNTMSKGMASTTPEIKNMANLLGMTVDGVRDLWAANPEQMFLKLGEAMAGMDEASIVSALDAIGLEGQRSMPMFQAIAKNIRGVGLESSALKTSLDAAAKGFSNPALLDEAVAGKADDLAGKLRILLNQFIGLGAEIGGKMAPVFGFLMDGLSGVLNLVTALVQSPIGTILTPIVGSIATFMSLMKGASALNLLFQGGQRAMEASFAGIGGRPGMGSIRTLGAGFGGRVVDYAPNGRNFQQKYMSTAAAQQANDRKFRNAAQGALVYGNAAEQSGNKAAKASRGLDVFRRNTEAVSTSLAQTATVTSKAATQVNSAARTGSTQAVRPTGAPAATAGGQAFRNVNAFVGGGVGWAVIGATIAAALVGNWVDAENQRTQAVTSGIAQNIGTLFTVNETTGLKTTSATPDQLIQASTSGLHGTYSFYDQIVASDFEAGRKDEAILQEALSGGLKEGLSTWDKVNRNWYGSWNRGENAVANTLERSLKKWGETFGNLESPEERFAMLDAIRKSNPDMDADDWGQFIDVTFKDNQGAFSDLIADFNAATGSEYSGIFADYDGAGRNEIGWAIQTALSNKDTSGSMASAGQAFDYVVTTGLEGAVSQWQMQTQAVNDSFSAQVAYHEALKQGAAYVTEYGQAMAGWNGEWDASNEKQVAAHNILTSFSDAASAAVVQLGKDVVDGSASFTELADSVSQSRDDFVSLAMEMGMTEAQANAVADSFGLIPDQVVSEWLLENNIDASTMDVNELMEVVGSIPEGKTMTLTSVTDEAKQQLIEAGYLVTTLPDGSIEVTALTETAQSKIESLFTYDGGTITINAEVLTDDARTELEIFSGILAAQTPGATFTIKAVSTEAMAVIDSLGLYMEDNGDGTFTITIPEGMSQEDLDRIIADLQAAADGNPVEIPTTVGEPEPHPTYHVPRQSGNRPGKKQPINPDTGLPFGNEPSGTGTGTGNGGYLIDPNVPNPGPTLPTPKGGVKIDYSGSGGFNFGGAIQDGINRANAGRQFGKGRGTVSAKLDPSVQSPVMTPQVDTQQADQQLSGWTGQVPFQYVPKPSVKADVTQATAGVGAWFNQTSGLRPVSGVGANTGQATSAVGSWFGMTTGLNPRPGVGADATSATGVSTGWNAFTTGLNPIPFMSANNAPATMTSLAWMMMAMGLRPEPFMGANAAPANMVLNNFINRVRSSNPRATINAVANTFAAEAALNWAARSRTSVIKTTVVTEHRSIGGRAQGGFTGYANGGFATGYYTGAGGKYTVAGYVHKGEYVIPKRDVDQRTKRPKADALASLMGGIPGHTLGNVNRGNASGYTGTGVTELGPSTINALARLVSTQLSLDGRVIANNVSGQNRRTTRIGSN